MLAIRISRERSKPLGSAAVRKQVKFELTEMEDALPAGDLS